ncbi:MAG: LysR family transcriptional regulator [Burkholderiales bacterium]|nr:LysR family transcriptional regulator [Burkholderiales bacterium]
MDLARFDLNLLRVFEALHVHRNVSLAAEALGVTQPAVSNALRRLRRETGDELFTRTPQGMAPTPRAERLAGSIAQAMGTLRAGLAPQAEFDPGRATRRFTMLMSDIGEIVFLPTLLRFLERVAPGVTLETVTLPTREARLAMESGAVDLAVGFLPDLKTGFYQQRVFSQTYLCMVRTDHPQIGMSMGLKSFREARHAVVSAQGTGHGIVEAVFERAGVELDVRVRLPHFLSVPMVIAETDLVVTVPQRLGEAFAKILPVRLLPHPLRIPPFQVNQYWHRRFHQEPANQWLRGNFARLFRQ